VSGPAYLRVSQTAKWARLKYWETNALARSPR